MSSEQDFHLLTTPATLRIGFIAVSNTAQSTIATLNGTGKMIDFDTAIQSALANVHKMVPGAKNLKLEEAIISEDDKLFEITYSFEVTSLNSPSSQLAMKDAHLRSLAALLGTRKQSKIFLIDAETGKFRGFRNKD